MGRANGAHHHENRVYYKSVHTIIQNYAHACDILFRLRDFVPEYVMASHLLFVRKTTRYACVHSLRFSSTIHVEFNSIHYYKCGSVSKYRLWVSSLVRSILLAFNIYYTHRVGFKLFRSIQIDCYFRAARIDSVLHDECFLFKCLFDPSNFSFEQQSISTQFRQSCIRLLV